MASKEEVIGKLNVRVLRGNNLAICDPLTHTSDPYVVLQYGNQATQESGNSSPSSIRFCLVAVVRRRRRFTFAGSLWLLLLDRPGCSSIVVFQLLACSIAPATQAGLQLQDAITQGRQEASKQQDSALRRSPVQKVKSSVQKKNANPVWNEVLQLSVTNPTKPVHLEVFYEDKFTADDSMGVAEINLTDICDAAKLDLKHATDGTRIKTIYPVGVNYLGGESHVSWKNGKVVQDIILKLTKAESGLVVLQLEWVHVPGVKL